MQLEEFAKRMPTKPKTVWECSTCGLIKSVTDNPLTGFADWSGIVVCPDCNSNMRRRMYETKT